MKVVIDTELIKDLIENEWGYEGIREEIDKIFSENGTPFEQIKKDLYEPLLPMGRYPMKPLHELKILPQYFEMVAKGAKRFELRKDDRDYKVGDLLVLKEYDGKDYTGRELGAYIITYILRNCSEYGLQDGYCILGFA